LVLFFLAELFFFVLSTAVLFVFFVVSIDDIADVSVDGGDDKDGFASAPALVVVSGPTAAVPAALSLCALLFDLQPTVSAQAIAAPIRICRFMHELRRRVRPIACEEHTRRHRIRGDYWRGLH
jgi:hypothetical protein